MNLASRVLGQSTRRLSDDFRAAHGHPIVLAETFVDPARFTGACYRAANWQPLGRTKGFARNPGAPVTWTAHGQPKEIFVYPLVHDAREQLRALDDAAHWRSEGEPVSLTANRLGSLFECLSTIAEFRSRRGRRYPLPTIVAIAAAVKLAGDHGVTAFAEFAQALSQEQLRALRAYYSHRLQRFTAPTVTTFHNIIATLDPDVLDRAVRTWAEQRSTGEEPVAIDGKHIRGAARHNPDGQNVLVAAAEHCCGLDLGQEAIAHKSNEIPAARTLASGLDLAGDLAVFLTVERWTPIGLGTVLVLVLVAREMRHRVESRRHRVSVRYPGGREVRIAPGTTILEASRANGIAHASVCGGRSRCSTCRVRVNEGLDALPPPSPEERRVLDRIGVPPDVRLACQLRPSSRVSVTPLLPPNIGPAEGLRAAAAMQGEERTITVLFADIRGFTGLAEAKLPYDVVFVLNRYFRSMGEAIEHAGGRVDKFIGDGIMALFGIDTTPAAGAAHALRRGEGHGGGAPRPEPAARNRSSGAASHRHRHPHRARHRRRDGLRLGGLGDRDRRCGEHREPARVNVETVRGAARRFGRGCVRGRRGPHGMARGGRGGARAPGAASRLHRRRRR